MSLYLVEYVVKHNIIDNSTVHLTYTTKRGTKINWTLATGEFKWAIQ